MSLSRWRPIALLVGLIPVVLTVFLAVVVLLLSVQPATRVSGNPMPLSVFKAVRPKESHVFTLRCQLSDLYVSNRELRNTHYCICLDEGRAGNSLWAFVPRDTEAGRRIFARLRDGQYHALTVRLLCDSDSDDVDIIQVLP